VGALLAAFSAAVNLTQRDISRAIRVAVKWSKGRDLSPPTGRSKILLIASEREEGRDACGRTVCMPSFARARSSRNSRNSTRPGVTSTARSRGR
jgi:hypothetical protein